MTAFDWPAPDAWEVERERCASPCSFVEIWGPPAFHLLGWPLDHVWRALERCAPRAGDLYRLAGEALARTEAGQVIDWQHGMFKDGPRRALRLAGRTVTEQADVAWPADVADSGDAGSEAETFETTRVIGGLASAEPHTTYAAQAGPTHARGKAVMPRLVWPAKRAPDVDRVVLAALDAKQQQGWLLLDVPLDFLLQARNLVTPEMANSDQLHPHARGPVAEPSYCISPLQFPLAHQLVCTYCHTSRWKL